jgi:hypothetical protein
MGLTLAGTLVRWMDKMTPKKLEADWENLSGDLPSLF